MSDFAVDKNKKQFGVRPVRSDQFSSYCISEIEHDFHNHPLFQLDSLHQLASCLMPKKQCRFVKPGMNLKSEFFHEETSPDGRDLDNVFNDIETEGSWVALYNIETHPDYKKLLNQIIQGVSPLFLKEQGSHFNVGGFIFISAPPAITPFHIDRENNFWLQLKGQKKMSVFDSLDRDIVSQEAVENFIVDRSLDDVNLKDSFMGRAQTFNMSAGKGLYFPFTTPHMTESDRDWVTVGDEVSVSLGVVFYTEWTRKFARICQFNHFVRRFGVNPSFPNGLTDGETLKSLAGNLIAKIKKNFRGYNPPPGSY